MLGSLVVLACLPDIWAAKPQLQGAQVGAWTMDAVAAVKLAKQRQLPIFVNFSGSDWCGACIYMNKVVFTQPDWQRYAAGNLVLVTLDFPKNKQLVPSAYVQRNRRLAQQFGVKSFPTMLLLEPDGKTVMGRLGATSNLTAKKFAEMVQDVVRSSSLAVRNYARKNPKNAEAYRAAAQRYRHAWSNLQRFIAAKPVNIPANQKHLGRLVQAVTDASSALKKY